MTREKCACVHGKNFLAWIVLFFQKNRTFSLSWCMHHCCLSFSVTDISIYVSSREMADDPTLAGLISEGSITRIKLSIATKEEIVSPLLYLPLLIAHIYRLCSRLLILPSCSTQKKKPRFGHAGEGAADERVPRLTPEPVAGEPVAWPASAGRQLRVVRRHRDRQMRRSVRVCIVNLFTWHQWSIVVHWIFSDETRLLITDLKAISGSSCCPCPFTTRAISPSWGRYWAWYASTASSLRTARYKQKLRASIFDQ